MWADESNKARLS